MAEIPLFPLNTVLFPGATLPLHIFEQRYRIMTERCLAEDLPFGVVLIRSGQEVGGPAETFEIGVTARIAHSERLDDGRFSLIAIGMQRFRIRETYTDQPYLTGTVEFLSDEDEDAPGIEQTMARVSELFTEYTRLTLALTDEWARRPRMPRRPGALADQVAARLVADTPIRQRLLEEISVPRRLSAEERLLQRGIEMIADRLDEVRRAKFGALGVLN